MRNDSNTPAVIGLEGHDLRRGIRNAAYSSLDYVIPLLLWLFATPLFVYRLGTEQYGIWMLANSLMGFEGVLSLGLADATVKFVAKYRAAEDRAGLIRVLRFSTTLYSLLGLLAGGLIFALSSLLATRVFNIEPEHQAGAVLAIRIASVGMFARFYSNIFASALHGFERYDMVAKIRMSVTSVTMLINMYLVFRGYGLATVLTTNVAAVGLGGLVMMLMLKRHLLPELVLLPAADRQTAEEMLSFGTYAWLKSIIGALSQNMDCFLLATFISPAVVTYYTVGKKLVTQVHILLTRASSFLFPFSSGLFERQETARLRKSYIQSTVAISVISSGMILPIYLLGESILTLWMGAEFSGHATPVLLVTCILITFMPVGIINYQFLLGTGKVKALTVISAITAPLTIAAMWYMIPRYGVVGAPLGQLIMIPCMFGLRIYANWALFGRPEPGSAMAYFIPVVIPLAFATLALQTELISAHSIAGVIVKGATLAFLCWGASYAVASACRKLRWIPAC